MIKPKLYRLFELATDVWNKHAFGIVFGLAALNIGLYILYGGWVNLLAGAWAIICITVAEGELATHK